METPYQRGEQWMKCIGDIAPLDTRELKRALTDLSEMASKYGPVHIELDYYDIFNFIPDEGDVYSKELLKEQLTAIPNVDIISYRMADGSYALESGKTVTTRWR